MKKIVLFLSAFCTLFISGGCIKDNKACQEKTVVSEDAAMLSLASSNGITAPTKHSSGMYYNIVSPGSGATPMLTSTLKVNYIGKFSNGTIFDQTNTTTGPATFQLNGVIQGWQIGLPLIKKGGIIDLIIPSSYAYGCTGRQTIPGYSILYFRIELIDVL